MPRPLPVLLLLGLCVSTLPAATDDTWSLAERFDFNGALDALDSDGASPASSADHRLARAALLLGAQPRTPDNIATALAEARALSADSDSAADLRLSARHLEGRILREHLEPRTPENLAAARAIFRELAESGSAHPLARRALVSLGLGLLHDEPGQPRAARLAAAEALVPLAAAHPAVERDLRYVIAQAALVWKLDPVIARDHLRRVDEIGFSQLPRRLNVLVALGRLAEETGDLALAEKAWRAFLDASVRDAREDTIRAYLAALEKRRAQPSAPR